MQFTNETLAYIHSNSWMGSRPGLSRTVELLERLGNPHKQLKFIHVAGTNGKGSTSAMLSSILVRAGYRTGLYTSPFIHKFNERMKIDGLDITDEQLKAATDLVRPHADAMTDPPTEFELITVIAMVYFAQNNCDIIVLEVGMGGLLDSTNVIDTPVVAVITNIGLDHTEQLGDTLEKIAAQKAGIIKENTDVVLYAQTKEVEEVVRVTAQRTGSRVYCSEPTHILARASSIKGQYFDYNEDKNLFIQLLGEHQLCNAAVVLKVVEVLRKKGYAISGEQLGAGLADATWLGRFEVFGGAPYFIIDGGHNPQCAETVADTLATYFPGQKAVFLTGVMADKDYTAMLAPVLPLAKHVVTVTPNTPRALPAEQLAAHISRMGGEATACQSIQEGVETAISLAGTAGIVCAFGSLYMAGDIREVVLQKLSDKGE